jgi:hypothetical protein
LKQSYYREAVRNLTKAEASLGERDLFSDLLSDEEAFDTTAVA